jgi:HSP20 family protein
VPVDFLVLVAKGLGMDGQNEYIRKIHVCRRQTLTPRRAFGFHQHEIHALFDELIHRPWGRAQWNPPVDIREDDENFIIEIDLPGVKPEEVRVTAEGNTLSIEGQRELRPCDDARTTHLCERPDGGFARMFEFAETLEEERIEGHWQNGVLTITVPRPKNR